MPANIELQVSNDIISLENSTLPSYSSIYEDNLLKSSMLGGLAPNLIEAELKFLVSRTVANREISTRACTTTTIHRSYFEDRDILPILSSIPDAQFIYNSIGDYPKITSGRLSKTILNDGTTIHEITFKSKKNSLFGANIARMEVEFEISKEIYEDLRSNATAGYIKKLRVMVERELQLINLRATPLMIFPEIDFPLDAGHSIKKDRLSSKNDSTTSFAFVDIDLSNYLAENLYDTHKDWLVEDCITSIRKGEHNLSCIKEGAYELSSLQHHSKVNFLSNKGIAKVGINKAEFQAHQALNRVQ